MSVVRLPGAAVTFPAGVDLPPETLRSVCGQAAAYLEGRGFELVMPCPPGDSDQAEAAAKVLVEAWVAGYRRAIHELRSLSELPPVVPDDLSEIDGIES